MSKVIGIDLGTTCSVAAWIDEDGRPNIIPNYDGDDITPSVILIDGTSTIVGKEAKRASVRHPDQCISFAKRSMGRRNVIFDIEDKKYSPEEASAIILRSIIQDCQRALNDTIEGAVITVPAYFTDAQRKSTQDAAKLAGIPLLAIINEPTAAALGYGISENDKEIKTILVYDLGGGTFDVCIMRIGNNLIETLAQDGDHDLGGYNFDKIIVDKFLAKAKEMGFDVASSPKALQELWNTAEDVKKTLSKKENAKIEISFKEEEISIPISQGEFEDDINSMVFSTISVMDAVMDQAGLTYDLLDKILLVGGSTRIPLVKRMIEEMTHIVPSAEMHPDKAVAIGAAYYAVHCAKQRHSIQEEKILSDHQKEYIDECIAYTENDENFIIHPIKEDISKDENISLEYQKNALVLPTNIPEYKFAGCTSHSIGVALFENEILVNNIVIPKNSKLPVREHQYIHTLESFQETVNIQITEGEFPEMEHIKVIATTELKIRPRDHLVDLRLTLECDENGLIHAYLVDLDDNIYLGEIPIPRTANMTNSELEDSSRKLGKLCIGEME